MKTYNFEGWSLMKEIYDLVPKDVVQQYNSRKVIHRIAPEYENQRLRILDLGSGDGKSLDLFRQVFSSFNWIGLDIEDSPEALSRKRTDGEFRYYDGVNIPFDDASFNMVFSNQVFEHVRYPEKLLSEVRRVLSKDGLFVGSVSYLEPYHSFSYFNYTPWGWYHLIKDCGLQLELLAGGIDSISLIKRSIDYSSASNSWWNLSPLNKDIMNDEALSIQQKNYKILMNAGHIAFCARKI